MTVPVLTQFERDRNADVGVMWHNFVTALTLWVYVNEGARSVTVGEAAMTFNTSIELVREAVGENAWLYFSHDADPAKQTIQSDGE